MLSNNQSRATLWVRETCLNRGTSASDNHLNLGLIVLRDIQHGTSTRMNFDMWSMSVETTLVYLHWMKLCMFGLVACNGSHRNPSLGCSILFGTERNILITKSQRVRAGIPAMRKPASREIISASVELCETEPLLLAHPTYWHKRVTSENAQELLLMLILRLPDLQQNQSPSLHCCAVFPTTILSVFTCVMNVRDQTRQAFVTCLSTSLPHEQVYSQTTMCPVSQYEPDTNI